MGFYEDSDSPGLYRLNVLEIPVDKLQREAPKDADGNDIGVGVPRNKDGTPLAINQGTVQVRCFIHPYCPFLATAKEEYDLAFNELTIPVINDVLPDHAKNAFTTTHGVEGMHFTERYVYRHNYIFKEEIVEDEEGKDVKEFTQVALPDYDVVNNTRYQDEFSWIIRPSVYDKHLKDKISLSSNATYFEQRCAETVSWQYVYPPITSSYDKIDEQHDYKTDYFNSNSKQVSDDNPGIDTTRIQVPRQSSATDCLGGGAHWKVEKKTQLFRGEDFFIEFKRYARASNVTTGGDKVHEVQFDNTQEQYAPIDVLGDQWGKPGKITLKAPKGLKVPPQDVHVNRAVRQDDEPSKRTAFRLFDQAYYVIEMGGPDTAVNGVRQHYFIIITERAYPIFVAIEEVTTKDDEGFLYSKTLSAYNEEAGGVHGQSLINADTFRITVRNHLGKLVINFDVNGDRKTPWIISQDNFNIIDDLVEDLNSVGASIPNQIATTVPIIVPRSKLSIWGGNLSCGFSFGPLQYSNSELKFRWPQKHALPMYFVTDPATGIKSRIDGPISARLTTSDEYIHDMARYTEIPGSPSNVVPMFTQGAHFYKQWGSGFAPFTDEWQKGSFFFGQGYDPLIELSKTGAGVRDTTVKLRTFNGINYDFDRRRAKFYLEVLLEAGSHSFGGGFLTGWRNMTTYQPITTSNLSDEHWVIEACKTPILTGIRLVGEPDSNPRWPDGTGPGGYTGKPATFEQGNKFFRDVSHHVLSYSENWTANDFYELEHSGTIRFLLKEINAFRDAKTGEIVTWNDTDYLKDLQDKNFYIEIWAGYEPLTDGLEYTQFGGFYKLMTGMCHGGHMEKTAAREIMTCQVKDYKEILKDQKFFNSPFYDGVRDVNAVLEILNIAGLRSKGQFDPGGYLEMLKKDDFSGTVKFQTGDGRFFTSNPYALPSSYRRIEQAYFKFDAGSTLYDGIVKIAQTASKLFYFDQHGMAHFESYFDLIQQNLKGNLPLESLFSFTSNPFSEFSALTGAETTQGQLIFNKVEWQYRQEDVHNHIKIISSTPNQELLIADDVRWESVDTPSVGGFVGYKKLFYQREGMLGSEGAVRSLIDFYRVMFRPELYVKFETHGLPIRATDFISVDGQFLRISKVSHDINAEKNLWWMNVEGERMQPIQ